ncbi:MAG: hypothetical protein E2O71_05935 [Deltaproteobacteria bacterium]|nr:MAG: hypothetical protein E2O71_05935 [Deltaproteobacteria bacterium]
MRRPWIRVAVALALLVISGSGWMLYFSRDLPAVDETGLLVDERPLPPDENAAVPLREAIALLQWPRSEAAAQEVRSLRTFSPWDQQRARDLVRRNEAALHQLEQAMRLPEIEISSAGLIPPGKPGELSLFVPVGRLLEVQCVRAALRLADGDRAGAFDDALVGLRLGDRIHRSRGSGLPHAMLGLWLKDTALSELQTLIQHATVDGRTARRLIHAIESARGEGDSWDPIWAGEYREIRADYESQLLQREDGWWVPSSYVLQHNRTLQRLADLYRGLQRNSRVNCAQMEVLTRTQPLTGFDRLRLVLAPNSIGNILYEVAVPRFGIQEKRCALASSASSVQVIIALKARFDAEHELPDSLGELVPELLPAVPRDGVRGEPVRYVRAERALYMSGNSHPWRLGF